MAYIIAHGTVNGYQKIQSTLSDNKELQILTDIRTEFDNTSSMLTKSEGYLLQMSPSGVWVSIVKSLMDGERSGGGAGFFAFSAFVPKEQMIAGQQLKIVLDKLMQHYLSLCPNFMTRNINVDWSFVTDASAELNALCQPRRKAINTCYVPSEQFAYVPITTNEEIVQYLDKPFQLEYGKYKAVFLGTHLQHPLRLPQQTHLEIDLENEEYDILWNGNVNGWNDLPYKVRKKEIASGSYTFKKDYYNPTIVQYSSGVRDDANTTLKLNVPNLHPQTNQITLQYNYPEAVGAVMVTNLPSEQIKGSVLTFKGEEFAQKWDVMIMPIGNYICKNFSIIPCKCPNSSYPVNIIKMQQVSLQILQNGNIQTKRWFDSIDIKNCQTNEKPEKRLIGNDISILIGAGENFLQNYNVTFSGNGYRITNPQSAGNTFYHISIIKNESSTESTTRKVYLELSKKIVVNQLSATLNSRNIPIDTLSSSISIEKQEHRKDVKFSYNGLPLKSRSKDKDRIKLTLTLWGLFKLNIKPILLVTGIALLLSLLVSCALILFKGIDIKGLFAQEVETGCFDPNRSDNGTPATPTGDTGTITEEQRLYNELESILKIQREKWCYDTIYVYVSRYENHEVAKETLHSAHYLYKELHWMQYRKRLDGYWRNNSGEWKQYTSFDSWINKIQDIKKEIENNNISYENASIFKDIAQGEKKKQKQFFKECVITKKVEKMTFPKVKELWDNFNVSSTSPPKDNKTNKSNNRSSANTGTSSNQSNPPVEENAENY